MTINMNSQWDRYYSRHTNEFINLNGVKNQLGTIPEQTCPNIDEVITALRNIGATKEIEIMENLRNDNAKLRDLGKAWYDHCSSMADAFEAAVEKIDELERELDIANDKIIELQKLQ